MTDSRFLFAPAVALCCSCVSWDRGGYFRWFEMYSLNGPSSVSVTKYGFFECFHGGGGVVMSLLFFFLLLSLF